MLPGVAALHQPALMLDLDAAVHHDIEPGGQRECGRLVVFDAELHPQTVRADGHSLLGDRRNVAAAPEAIDHLDLYPLGPQRIGRSPERDPRCVNSPLRRPFHANFVNVLTSFFVRGNKVSSRPEIPEIPGTARR